MSCFKVGDTLPKSAVGGGTSVKIVPPRDSTKGGVKPDILVQFRPSQSHLGKFGFDWLRMDDSGLSPVQADVKYTDNVGHHTDAKGNKCKSDSCVLANASRFTKEPALAKKLKSTFTKEGNLTNLSKQVTGLDKDFEYRIPVMTLMPKDKTLNPHNVNLVAKLDTIIHHGKKRAKSLRLAYKDASDEKAAKGVIVVNSMSIAKNSTKTALSITSKGILKKSVILYVYADKCHQPCGAIKILRNDKVKHINVVFVGTKTNLGLTKKTRKKQIAKMTGIKELRKKLGQALININLAIDKHPVTKKELILDMTTKFTSKHMDTSGRLSWDNAARSILNLLTTEFTKQISASSINLTGQTYVFHFLPEVCHSVKLNSGIAGGAGVNENHSMYFADNAGKLKPPSAGTLTHELGHNLGLQHTFEQSKSSYRYKFITTDNIMDYSHIHTQFYYWQWKIINKSGIE